jgi:phosphocarrier protein HPr
MIRKEIIIRNRNGLHARPAAQFVKLAAGSQSEVWVEKEGSRVNGRSIMGMMLLSAEQGASLTIEVNGPDEEDLWSKISDLVANRFHEE